MKLLGKKEKKQLFWYTFGTMFIAFAFLGFIIGAVLGLTLHSFFPFWASIVITPIAIPYWLANKQAEHQNALLRQLNANVMQALSRVDYVATSYQGAIAVDVSSRSIAVAGVDKEQAKVTPPVIFSAEKIKSYKAFAPGRDVIETIGDLSTSERLEKVTKNVESARNANYATGLYFDLDDIRMPKVFAQMEFADAEKWMLIIEKLGDGSLESQTSPLVYPTPL